MSENTWDDWIYEDELPEGYPYDEAFPHSAVVDGVRVFPPAHEIHFKKGYEQAMREFWSYDEGQEPTCVVPGMKYGIYGEMIPCCRSVEAMMHILDNATVFIKPAADILDEERAQRGPDGVPLRRVTPMVPFLTRAEWDARNPKPQPQ